MKNYKEKLRFCDEISLPWVFLLEFLYLFTRYYCYHYHYHYLWPLTNQIVMLYYLYRCLLKYRLHLGSKILSMNTGNLIYILGNKNHEKRLLNHHLSPPYLNENIYSTPGCTMLMVHPRLFFPNERMSKWAKWTNEQTYMLI